MISLTNRVSPEAVMEHKLRAQLRPFEDAHSVLQIMVRHGMQLSHVTLIHPIWLALQLSDLDNAGGFETFCQKHNPVDLPKDAVAKPLFWGTWSIGSRLVDKCWDSIKETKRSMGNHAEYQVRYRSWILANAFVSLYCLNCRWVISEFLTACGWKAHTRDGQRRCASLLPLLTVLGRGGSAEAPKESLDTVEIMWSTLGRRSSDSFPLLRLVINLVRIGVYPRIKSSAYSRETEHGMYMHDVGRLSNIFWPAELGTPPGRWRSFPDSPGVDCLRDHPHNVVFVQHRQDDRGNWRLMEEYGKKRTHSTWTYRGGPHDEWMRVQCQGLAEGWEWTTLAGKSLEANQLVLRDFCRTVHGGGKIGYYLHAGNKVVEEWTPDGPEHSAPREDGWEYHSEDCDFLSLWLQGRLGKGMAV